MNKHKYGGAALLCLLLGVLMIDSPLWVISLISIIAAGVCTIRGELWDWTE